MKIKIKKHVPLCIIQMRTTMNHFKILCLSPGNSFSLFYRTKEKIENVIYIYSNLKNNSKKFPWRFTPQRRRNCNVKEKKIWALYFLSYNFLNEWRISELCLKLNRFDVRVCCPLRESSLITIFFIMCQ